MDYQEIIKIARQILNCPVCGRPFEEDKVRLTAMIDDKVIIQSSCERNHLPIVTIFLTVFSPQFDHKIGIRRKRAVISGDEVADLTEELKHFDGDFHTLFQSIDQINQ